MFENCTLTSTADMSREEWLKARRRGIGGSDASAILGLNPWQSAYTTWLSKLGRLPDKEDTEATRQGRDLEDYVSRRFMEQTGKKVQRCNYTIRNNDYPWALANIDRRVIGENAGLECKTTSTLDLKQFRDVEFPEKYYVQCVHYLAVTGAERWYLAVLVFGKEFHVYTLERNEAEIEALMNAEAEFWKKVTTNQRPELDGSDATLEALKGQYPGSDANARVDLTGCAAELAVLEACQKQIQALEAKEKAAKARIMDFMGKAERGEFGEYSVSWKPQTRTTFDKAKWEARNGKIPAEFLKTSASRVFRFTKE